MIIGFGSDLCDIKRIEKLIADASAQFLNRCFTEHEQSYADMSDASVRAARLAKRFAAKEAMAKALGCGIGENAFLRDIEVRKDKSGKPQIVLTGRALETLHSLLPANARAKLHVSLSDEAGLAFAQVIIEAVQNG